MLIPDISVARKKRPAYIPGDLRFQLPLRNFVSDWLDLNEPDIWVSSRKY